MKKLLIVESPGKIKTITKFLGKDFIVTSTRGHIKDLPLRELGVSIDKEGKVVLSYEVLEDKQKIINSIIADARKAELIYLAPDPDREGEIIALHTYNEIKEHIPQAQIYRITFNEITKTAILDAVQQAHDINAELVAAQQARRILDRWVGYQVSPILWRKLAKGLSAGRVQSVALKLICMREEELRAFVVEEYWTIHGLFSAETKGTLSAELIRNGKEKPDLKDEKSVQELLPLIKKSTWSVTGVKDSKRSRKPLPPFTTSTLQQAAYNKLGFSVNLTMQLAQKLYEGIALGGGDPTALITYMRTDSTRIASIAIDQARTFIKKEFGSEYVPGKAHLYSKSAAQDAHEAIRPIDILQDPAQIAPYLEKDVHALYELIWKRFVACQMSPASYAQRQITIGETTERFVMRASGSVLLFDGFLKVYEEQDEQEEAKQAHLPDCTTGIPLTLKEVTPKQHFTQPPPRYTEATLVKELESERIGRPSTYATILKTIQARDYTHLDEKRRFVPTELGMQVVRLLDTHMTKIMDIGFTAQMEENLDKIARGEVKRDEILHAFYTDFSQAVDAFAQQKTGRTVEDTKLRCKHEECVGTLLVKLGKSGQFLGCSQFPTCTYTARFERGDKGEIKLIEQETKLLETRCEMCSKQLQERHGKYGPFIACSGYPACKYVYTQKTQASCPECKKEKLAKRFWKSGTFWGCAGYPECTYRISGDIIEQSCSSCGFPFMKKTSQKENADFICANASCPSIPKK